MLLDDLGGEACRRIKSVPERGRWFRSMSCTKLVAPYRQVFPSVVGTVGLECWPHFNSERSMLLSPIGSI